MKSEDEFLNFLNKRNLKLGLTLKVNTIEPFDGSMLISYGNKRKENLSHTVRERLLGERV